MAACPNIQTIDDLLTGRLPPAQRDAFYEHLEHCRACGKVLARMPGDERLAAEVRDGERARRALTSALAGLKSAEESITSTLFGGGEC
ncbi:MAG: zf-HC2 domain-containing protein [Phycisphaerae bacterium]